MSGNYSTLSANAATICGILSSVEFAVKHSGGNTLVRNIKLQQTYKPVIAYCKPPLDVFWHPFVDMVSGGRSKDNHEWEQPVYLYIIHPSFTGGFRSYPVQCSLPLGRFRFRYPEYRPLHSSPPQSYENSPYDIKML